MTQRRLRLVGSDISRPIPAGPSPRALFTIDKAIERVRQELPHLPESCPRDAFGNETSMGSYPTDTGWHVEFYNVARVFVPMKGKIRGKR